MAGPLEGGGVKAWPLRKKKWKKGTFCGFPYMSLRPTKRPNNQTVRVSH